MISNLEAQHERTVTDMLTPQRMVDMMRSGYSIGVPLENVKIVADKLIALLEDDERLAYQQTCEELMDIFVAPNE